MSRQHHAAIGRTVGCLRTLRPAPHLLRQGVISFVALTTPVFAVLYWLTIATDTWMLVLAFQLVVCLLGVLTAFGYSGASIQVGGDAVRERGFFGGRRNIPAAEIGSILVLDTYRSSALDTQQHLFIRGHDGRLLMRMRGSFWSRTDMDAVIESLDVPTEVSDGTFTMTELRRTHPELLYWFERLPPFAAHRVRA